MFFDDAFPVETEEERRRRMVSQLTPLDTFLNASQGQRRDLLDRTTPADALVSMGLLGGNGTGRRLVAPSAGDAINSYAQMLQAQTPRIDLLDRTTPADALVSMGLLGGNGIARTQPILEPLQDTGRRLVAPSAGDAINSYTQMLQSQQAPTTAPNVYQHYSATANRMSPEVVAAQASRQDSAVDRDTAMGRFVNGVYINDGFNSKGQLIEAPVANVPGAGYVRQGIDAAGNATFISIPHSGDAGYSARLAMDPYTNPFIQDGIRQHERKMELQAQAINGELLKAQMLSGGRNDSAIERNLMRGLQISGDPRLPTTTRNTIIDNLQLPDKDKEMMKLDAAMTQLGPNKEPIEISPVKITSRDKEGRATGRTIDMTEFLNRVPKGTSQETLWQYLKERRNMTREDVVSHLKGIYDEAADPKTNPYVAGLTSDIKLERLSPARRKEHDLIMQFLGRR